MDPPLTVLWSDETALAVDKPSGLLVHASAWSGPREASLRSRLVAQVGEAVHPVHRLDRGASGVVLFARSGDAARLWQSVWRSDATVKEYLALVRGRLEAEVLVDHPIRSRRTGGSVKVSRPARSHVWPVAVSALERCSLVRVQLLTGRRHQIRRHLKHLGHPVVGDTTWGKGDVNRHYRERYGLHRLALHAGRLVLPRPGTGPSLGGAPVASSPRPSPSPSAQPPPSSPEAEPRARSDHAWPLEVRAPVPPGLAHVLDLLFAGVW